MQSLNDFVMAGKVLYLGVSDTPAWVAAKANQYARDHNLRHLFVYQGVRNARMRDCERDIVPMARNEDMALFPNDTLGPGRFETENGFQVREKHNPGRDLIPLSQFDKEMS